MLQSNGYLEAMVCPETRSKDKKSQYNHETVLAQSCYKLSYTLEDKFCSKKKRTWSALFFIYVLKTTWILKDQKFLF